MSDLERFVSAQESVYEQALVELRKGRKRTHWMWFVFPQIDGLGHSAMAKRYAIKDAGEARAYLTHPVLGPRLAACSEALLAIEGRSASQILGYPDDLKLKSCMTLFEAVSEEDTMFSLVLEKYYEGQRDDRTLELLAS